MQIGIIPDANAIHLAKKQREIARRKQEQETTSQLPTFIPINKRTTMQELEVEKPQHNSRLIREEMDVDLSEEDESLTLNHNSDKKRTVKMSYDEELTSEEDDEVILQSNYTSITVHGRQTFKYPQVAKKTGLVCGSVFLRVEKTLSGM